MGCPSEVIIGNSLVFSVCTHDPETGELTDADAVPTYRVYEDETSIPILTGSMAKLDDVNTTGFYTETIACTAANGFENGKTYTIYIVAAVAGHIGGKSYGFKAYNAVAEDGQYEVTIFVKETITLEALVGCDVDIWTGVPTDLGSVRYTRRTTEGLGRIVVWLDAGTYKVYLHNPTHTAFALPESITVTGNQTFTLFGDDFDPGTIPADTVRIYDWEHLADGATAAEDVRVAAWPTEEGVFQAWGGVGGRSLQVSAQTDADGYWYLDLSPSTEYDFDLTRPRGKLYSRVETPASGSSQLKDLF